VASNVVVGFADREVNALLDVDPAQEAVVCLVALGAGAGAGARASASPPVVPLELATQRLSAHQVDYPLIMQAHRASSLASGDDVIAWRRPTPSRSNAPPIAPVGGRIEQVILRRGSSRGFSHEPITQRELELVLTAATTPIPSDAPPLTQPYLLVNAVEDLDAGAYTFDRSSRRLERLKSGNFRREAAFLDLGQELAGDAAVNVYWLGGFEHNRDYRAAQLEAAIEGGKLYLAAYALGLGATGLTFFDDEVVRFFSPRAAGKAVLFLTAVGHPAKRALT
jgi:Nitroreductase family